VQKVWMTCSPEAYHIRDQLLHAFRFAFRKDPVLLSRVAVIAGQSAPAGKRMGHAGAIISSGSGTAEEKIKAFNNAGVPVAKEPGEIPALVKKGLGL
jgi:succinyl-CoA synthetase alpha subunit